MNEFCTLLKKFRTRSQLSQKALAIKAGLDQSHLNRLERGIRSIPKKRTIIALTEALELSHEDRIILLQAAGYESSDLPNKTKLKGKSARSVYHSPIDPNSDFTHPAKQMIDKILGDKDIDHEKKVQIIESIQKYGEWLLEDAKK